MVLTLVTGATELGVSLSGQIFLQHTQKVHTRRHASHARRWSC